VNPGILTPTTQYATMPRGLLGRPTPVPSVRGWGTNPLSFNATLRQGLQAYLPLNEDATSGDVSAVDWTGLGPNFTSNNTVASTTGRFGNGRTFVRANTEWLSAAYSPQWAFGNAAYTLTVWVRYASWPTGNDFLISQDNLNSNISSLSVFAGVAGGRSLGVVGFSGNSFFTGNVGSSATIALNAWHFFAVRHELNSPIITLRLHTASGGRFSGGIVSTTGSWNGSVLDINIGRRNNATNYAGGDIDEIAKWGRVLSDAELDAIWNSGAGIDLTQP